MRVKRELPSIRVLGVDPAAAGPTGYGIIEGDGRQCRMLHYGALCPPEKRRRESAGGTLRAVHELLGRLIVADPGADIDEFLRLVRRSLAHLDGAGPVLPKTRLR